MENLLHTRSQIVQTHKRQGGRNLWNRSFEEHRNKLLKELGKFRGNVRGPEDDGILGYLNGNKLRYGAEDMRTSATT